MFSDSHAHILSCSKKLQEKCDELKKSETGTFSQMNKKPSQSSTNSELICSGEEMMEVMQREDFRFVMDIGTEPGDLGERIECVRRLGKGHIPSFIHFSAGLWPHKKTIEDACTSLKLLEKDIILGLSEAKDRACDLQGEKSREAKAAMFALGECGLDRYWNGKEAPCLQDGGTLDVEGEEALFVAQLKMAKKYNLALIIHSRDSYQQTLRCIDEVGYHKGVIHCYSYGVEEARSFLERGWYISFVGNITFAKTKVKIKQIEDLVSSIPKEKLLLETDSPYMAPNPLRGKTNTPVYIKHTYARASEYLKISVQELCDIVYENCIKLFAISS